MGTLESLKIKLTTLTFVTLLACAYCVPSNLLCLDERYEQSLLESVLVESAVTVSQKAAVQKYLTLLVAKKTEQLQRYEEASHLSYGGKRYHSESKKKEHLQKVKQLQKELQTYVHYLEK